MVELRSVGGRDVGEELLEMGFDIFACEIDGVTCYLGVGDGG